MKPALSRIVLLLACSAALIAMPVTAAIVLTDTVLQPASVALTPIVVLKVVARISVIPAGATTFPEGHRLQMQTGLSGPVWLTQVYVDGIPAAGQRASGDAAFVNGYLLSYGTNHDVSLSVTVTGTVPFLPGQQVMLMNIEELDNSGSVVPGSSITISRPGASSPGGRVADTTPVLPPAPSGTGPVPSPTRAGGLSAPAGIAACAVTAALILAAGRNRE